MAESIAEALPDALPLLNSILHSTGQLLGGVAAGVVIDWAFARSLRWTADAHPDLLSNSAPTTAYDAIITSLEVAAQVAVSGMVIGAVYNWLSSLSGQAGDPSSGIWFSLAIFTAQPVLRARLAGLITYIQREFLAAEWAGESTIKSWLSSDSASGGGDRKASVLAGGGVSNAQVAQMHRRNGFIPTSSFAAAAAVGK